MFMLLLVLLLLILILWLSVSEQVISIMINDYVINVTFYT